MIAAGITGSERNVQFIETVSRNREDFLERGVIDIVVGTYSITAERRQRVAFTAPYYYAGQDVLVRAEDKTISGVAALAGKRVCSGTGSTSLDRLRSQIPRARLVVVDVYSECMPALIDGQVDAISTDDTILLGLMSRYPNQVRLLRKPFAREPYGIGVHRGDTAFRDYLNGLLGGYLRDGGWDRAFRDTIGTVGVTATVARPSVG
jgi:glutamate transport system substrate-binding protein